MVSSEDDVASGSVAEEEKDSRMMGLSRPRTTASVLLIAILEVALIGSGSAQFYTDGKTVMECMQICMSSQWIPMEGLNREGLHCRHS